MKRHGTSEFELEDGTIFYAYSQVLGIGEGLNVSYGSDGDICGRCIQDEFGEYTEEYGIEDRRDNSTHRLTPAQHAEIADYMIDLWTKYKEQYKSYDMEEIEKKTLSYQFGLLNKANNDFMRSIMDEIIKIWHNIKTIKL